MTQYKGLIFDFNGVLWWDNRLQEEAWRAFSAELRGYPLTVQEMAEHVHGRNNRYTMAYLAGRELDAGTAERLSEQKETIYRNLCLAQGDGFRLSPGAVSLLDFLVREQIPHTIATASGQGNVDFFVEHLQLERWFEPSQIVCDDGTLAGKPAPDFYLAAAAQLALDPQECVVIEDSLAGMQGARAAQIGRLIALVGDNDDLLQADLPEDVWLIEDLSAVDRLMFVVRDESAE